MNIDDLVEIYECPLCGGAGILEEDCGSSYYVTCLECGCHSVNIDFKSDDDRLDAAKRTADLWNCGKVISMSPGEGWKPYRVVNWLLIYTYDYSIFYLIN